MKKKLIIYSLSGLIFVVTVIWVYPFYSSNHVPLSKIPKILSPETAIKYSDIVVDAGGNTTNTAKFFKFLENIGRKKKDDLRIIHYTDEGAPVICDYFYNGKNIVLTYDTTRDGWGSRDVRKYNVSKIDKTENERGTGYSAVFPEGSVSMIFLKK